MAEAARALVAPPSDDHDHIVILRGVTWADYERVLKMRGDHSAPRISFLEGALEIMSPSRTHESLKSMIGRLVEAWCMENEIDITPYGSWTLKEKAVERGAEPDECYVVGDELEPERPDLAIEVVWTSGGINKLEIDRKLGVREVWYWQKGELSLYTLRRGRYARIPRSKVLPGIDHAEIAELALVRPMTKAVRAYRKRLQKRR